MADQDKLDEVLETTLDNVQRDRERLSSFLDQLIAAVTNSEESSSDRVIMSADSVAKIADSLMKNNQLRVNVAGIIAKRAPAGETEEEADQRSIRDAIARPFDNKLIDDN